MLPKKALLLNLIAMLIPYYSDRRHVKLMYGKNIVEGTMEFDTFNWSYGECVEAVTDMTEMGFVFHDVYIEPDETEMIIIMEKC